MTCGNPFKHKMQKVVGNFLYWILVKSAESYYGDSLKTKEYPYPYNPYFQNNYQIKGNLL